MADHGNWVYGSEEIIRPDALNSLNNKKILILAKLGVFGYKIEISRDNVLKFGRLIQCHTTNNIMIKSFKNIQNLPFFEQNKNIFGLDSIAFEISNQDFPKLIDK